MNVELHDVISSLTGVSGLAVVHAILQGERDPERLLALCDRQIQRAKAERVKESLRGSGTRPWPWLSRGRGLISQIQGCIAVSS